MSEKILEVKDLVVEFNTDRGKITAVNGVDFTVQSGKTLGIVGESGSGKSVSALSIMRLIQTPPGKISSGEILYRSENLLEVSDGRMRDIRGNKIAMIFQEPMTSLNPVFKVGNQIDEVLKLHQKELSIDERTQKVIELLNLVGIPSPEQRATEYPHQLSGGMRQRVMIAMSLACRPDILICDEPTTALDVTIQAQVLELIKSLQNKFNMGVILITHDLGVVAEVCDDVAVMYCGQIIESSDIYSLFKKPKHPYTKGLIESIPTFDSDLRQDRLKTIPGAVPSLFDLPEGCNFQDRCQFATSECRGEKGEPALSEIESDHRVRCFFPIKAEGN